MVKFGDVAITIKTFATITSKVKASVKGRFCQGQR
jgi:hypothetical protein